MKRILHREENWVFPFISYTPEKMEGKLPLVLQLHGSGERGNGREELERVEKWGFPEMVKTGSIPVSLPFPNARKTPSGRPEWNPSFGFLTS